MSIFVRYRLLSDETHWFVQWLCGLRWIIVYGPSSEAEAREYLDGIVSQAL